MIDIVQVQVLVFLYLLSIQRTMSVVVARKMAKRSNVSRHFHCYCLFSLDAKHPYKTYVGFTTNPHRRLRQHNGILKSGGAKRTKKAGRPWDFCCVVANFPSQRAALQFEWAWQHCDKSLAVRHAVGSARATTLKRMRGVKGQLSILKTLVGCLEGLYERETLPVVREWDQALTIYFFDPSKRELFDSIETELPPNIQICQVESTANMPFWLERKVAKQSNSLAAATRDGPAAKENAVLPATHKDETSYKCILCPSPLCPVESIICGSCFKRAHEMCAAMTGSGVCPKCRTPWDIQVSSDEDDSDEEMDVFDLVGPLKDLHIDDGGSTDNECDDDDPSSSVATQRSPNDNVVICLLSDDEDCDETLLPTKKAVVSMDDSDCDHNSVIDLCSP